MNDKFLVYILTDPRYIDEKDSVRYVGKTEQGTSRYKEHLKPSSLKNNTHKDYWIKELLSLGLKPGFKVIETFDNNISLFEAEIKWYNHYVQLGCYLTNLTTCGKGSTGYKHKEITIQRLKEKARLRDKTPYQNPHNKKKNIEFDGEIYRNCIKCKKSKILEEFTWNESKHKFQSYCKDCNYEYQKKWREKNPISKLSPEEASRIRKENGQKSSVTLKEYFESNPEARKNLSKKRSKAIIGEHIETNEIIKFDSALKAKEAGFQNSNIGQAIKYSKPYKNYRWKFA